MNPIDLEDAMYQIVEVLKKGLIEPTARCSASCMLASKEDMTELRLVCSQTFGCAVRACKWFVAPH